MFGYLRYKVKDKLFGFLVTEGIVLTKLCGLQKKEIVNEFELGAFKKGSRTMTKWVHIPLTKVDELNPVITYLQ
ncbi:MAG: hypothetical protein GF311_25130 [Candidatus Lokiarchaeota archaeon]|nr:hypothetical protein [Candidatus Lokiarchaeota archaeon]